MIFTLAAADSIVIPATCKNLSACPLRLIHDSLYPFHPLKRKAVKERNQSVFQLPHLSIYWQLRLQVLLFLHRVRALPWPDWLVSAARYERRAVIKSYQAVAGALGEAQIVPLAKAMLTMGHYTPAALSSATMILQQQCQEWLIPTPLTWR